MRKCIFCLKEKPEEEFSDEHVFPYAIGGRKTIKNVCKCCNSQLGRNADSELVNNPLIKMIRYRFKIRNEAGVIPNPLPVGKLASDESRDVHIIIDKDGKYMDCYITPKVSSIDETGVFKFEIDEKDRYKIDGIIQKKAERGGFDKPEINQTIITQRKVTKPKMTNRYKLVIPYRALLKIAYEIACEWLGDSYISDEIAINYRNIIMNEKIPVFCINSYLLHCHTEITYNCFMNFKFIQLYDNDSSIHFAAMINDNEHILLELKIFNFYRGIINISNRPELYSFQKRQGELMPPPKLIVLNSSEAQFIETNYFELIKQISQDFPIS